MKKSIFSKFISKLVHILSVVLFILCFNPHSSGSFHSLLIGMSHINDSLYKAKYNHQFSNDATSGVSDDIYHMMTIGEKQDHQMSILLDEKATKKAILDTLRKIGMQLAPGDYFLFYFTGHGNIRPDRNGDESTGFDQALVAYDEYIIDDEIYQIYTSLFTKTKNIMIIDACHSSTSFKMAEYYFDLYSATRSDNRKEELAVIENQRSAIESCEYDQTQYLTEPFNMIYLGATGDFHSALGFSSGGLLTSTIWNTYKRANVNHRWKRMDYRKFACEVNDTMLSNQQILQYHEVGSNNTIWQETPLTNN